MATKHGATLAFDEAVQRWVVDGSGVRVQTARRSYRAARLVITTGPWASELLADLRLPLRVQRVVNAHFEPTRPEMFAPDRCPIYIWQVPEGEYYGFPNLPEQGIKVGGHDIGETCTPYTIRREIDDQEIGLLRAMLDRYMPGASGPLKWALTCMYTMTPDSHFILDRHPAYPQVVYGCGFSGHGFKFSSVIGEILADLALDGHTRHPIEFLSAARFATPSVRR
jgi:sarcosine oxidase